MGDLLDGLVQPCFTPGFGSSNLLVASDRMLMAGGAVDA